MPPASIATAQSYRLRRRIGSAGFLVGFALGGFFDGILLHQILQWHHLLSAVDGAGFRDIRVQILADGTFHAAMYAFALRGLWLLWRFRLGLAVPDSGRQLAAAALVGFGAWHIADGVLSHWVLGIHRIRMDAGNPLLWDLLWFVLFGIAFVVGGWLVRRGGNGGAAGDQRGVAAVLVLAVLAAGPVAALPPAGTTRVMVLFRPGMTARAVFAAVAEIEGRPIWNDASGQLWLIDVGRKDRLPTLYRHGALPVGYGLLPAGCLDWMRA